MNTNTNVGAQTSQTTSEGTKAQQSVMAEILRPRWCIQRDDNTLVPLIALDELPDSVVLKDVPVTVTVLEALRAHMELIPGAYPSRGFRYELLQPLHVQNVTDDDDSGSDSPTGSAGSEGSTRKDSSASGKMNKNEGAQSQDKTLVRVHSHYSHSHHNSFTVPSQFIQIYLPLHVR